METKWWTGCNVIVIGMMLCQHWQHSPEGTTQVLVRVMTTSPLAAGQHHSSSSSQQWAHTPGMDHDLCSVCAVQLIMQGMCLQPWHVTQPRPLLPATKECCHRRVDLRNPLV